LNLKSDIQQKKSKLNAQSQKSNFFQLQNDRKNTFAQSKYDIRTVKPCK
jgi:hypothetical protein